MTLITLSVAFCNPKDRAFGFHNDFDANDAKALNLVVCLVCRGDHTLLLFHPAS